MTDDPVDAFCLAGHRLLGKLNGKDDEIGQFVKFQAPFTFVPLGPVCPSPWDNETPSHQRPHPDGVSGELTVRWTFDQSVLIGGAEGNGAFATLDGKKILPGSTARGLIRNVLEIATGSRMRLVDRKAHHGVRDMDDESKHWARHNPLAPEHNHGKLSDAQLHGFWLTHAKARGNEKLEKVHDGWRLTSCQEIKIETQKLFDHWQLTPEERAEFSRRHVRGKYDWVADKKGVSARIRFDIDDSGKAVPSRMGAHEGWLFFTGTDPKNSKAHETIFFGAPAPDEKGMPAPEGMIRRFFDIYGTGYRKDDQPTGALGIWLEALASGELAALPGETISRIPVFLVRHDPAVPKITEISLAKAAPHHAFLAMSRMVKVPHKRSIGQILDDDGHSADGRFLDFAEALFGFVPDEIGEEDEKTPTSRARKGRVAFGIGALVEGGADEPSETTGVTMAPRTSYWPFYAAPKPGAPPKPIAPPARGKTSDPADWSSDHVTVAGWKRYPVRPSTALFQQGDKNVTSTMRFTRAGIAFEQRIKLHNVLPEELGGLLWALTLGAPDGLDGGAHRLRHALGRGKAQGYGRCFGKVLGLGGLERNDGETLAAAADLVAAFKAYVLSQAKARRAAGEAAPEHFDAIPRIATLLGTADPAVGAKLAARLAYPNEKARATTRNDADGETPSLAGYRKIRKAAREKGRPGEKLERILPAYPRREPEA